MAKRKKTLFIVGNGPLLFDMSEHVDSCDHVVRFNEPKTSFGMSGTKTDWLFVCNTGKPMRRRLKNPDYPKSPIVQSAELVFLVIHPIAVEKYTLKPNFISRLRGRRAEWTWASLMMYGKAGKTVAVLPPSFYEESCRDLGIDPVESLKHRIFPSTGYLGIRYALEKLPAEEWRVEIAGFSWQGWKKHAWNYERDWIERKAAEREIRLWPSKDDERISKKKD
ncbi:glycosyltransferase family 29 protein [Chelativorans intermedius]|uniref:Glycosyltransferase family 29 protein n=1 Tax=Chelativorans intermedius TaxID=515947 RepID=A0ABV6D366_9HYPH|nr:glycosyltransferase family 29 protein [Chelativorans intermedius]MCT8998433.1 glycosyltransferase family 29 protein [Chelativorans intermedius]